MPKLNDARLKVAGILAPLVIIVAVALAYSNSLSGPFVLDDLPSIVGNSSIRQLGTSLSTPVASSTHGRPILNLSFALNYAINSYSVEGYHFTNIAIHMANALLLYGIVRLTLEGSLGAFSTWVAGATALLWAVHPLNTEAVTYTVQRAESLMGFFLLLALYSFIRFEKGASGSSWSFGALCVVSCLLGMATKEVMVSAPIIIWLYDRTFFSKGFCAALRDHWKLYSSVAATWLVLAALVLSTHGRGGTAGFDAGVPIWSYCLTQAYAISHYLRLCIFPHPLIFYYGRGLVTNPIDVLGDAALVIGLLAVTIWALVKAPSIGFLGAVFFVLLAPSSSFVPVATETVAEHRMYLPLIPVVLLGVLGVYRWLGTRGLWIVPPVALVLAGATFARNESYRSALRLWSETVADDPANSWAHNNLGGELDSVPGRAREAMAEYEIALKLKPDHAEAHYNLANDLRLVPGKLDDAIGHYEAAIRYAPAFAKAHNNLGGVLAEIPGRLGDAIAHYREALRLDPGYAEAHFNLGNAWSKVEGRQGDAIDEYRAALQLRPAYVEAYDNLAKVLAENPQTQPEAIEQWMKAIAIDPAYPEAQYNLGTALSAISGQTDNAIAHLREAIRLRPDYAEAQNNLANLLATLPGHWDEAIALYRKALDTRPDYTEEHYNLAVALLKRAGHEEEAKAHLRAFLQLEPGNSQAQELLESLDNR
jgi:tetratricopeptide (TPR) repeat protein